MGCLLVGFEEFVALAFGDGIEGKGDDETDDFEGRPECVFHDGGTDVFPDGKPDHLFVFGHVDVGLEAILEDDLLGTVDLHFD